MPMVKRLLWTSFVVASLAIPATSFAAVQEPAASPSRVNAACARGWIALTFDDGASSFRPRTLQVLRDKRVPATFFELGVRTQANPQFAQFEDREGYLVLNHSFFHRNLTSLTADQVRKEIVDTESALRAAGVEMRFKAIRLPFLTGSLNADVQAVLTSLKYTAFLRSDYAINDSDAAATSDHIRDVVLGNLKPDTILLMHDGNIDTPAGAATVAALPQIIDGVQAAGYCFGTLDATGKVVPAAAVVPSTRPIPVVTAPVPYLPLVESLRGTPPQEPPAPYVIVQPSL